MFRKLLLGLLLMSVAGLANATFYVTPKFKMSNIFVGNTGNFPVRIPLTTFSPAPACMTTGYKFGYLDDSDVDFNSKFVALMMAYKSGKYVIATIDDSNALGCHVIEISVWDTYP